MSTTHDTYNDEITDWKAEARALWRQGRYMRKEHDHRGADYTEGMRDGLDRGGMRCHYLLAGFDGKPFRYEGL